LVGLGGINDDSRELVFRIAKDKGLRLLLQKSRLVAGSEPPVDAVRIRPT